MQTNILNSMEEKINYLKNLDFNMFEKDLLATWDLDYSNILALLSTADVLEDIYQSNISLKLFQSGLGVSIFRDKSTRTRMAYCSACDMLGLMPQEIDENQSQVSHGETLRETANMVSFLTEAIGVRDDIYLGRGHSYMTELAEALDDSYRNGVLWHRPAFVNLQSDYDHPTQTMADLLHMRNYFGGMENLRNKKIVMSWAYSASYGKPLSVPQGIITLMSRLGMNVVLAHPEGYDLIPEIVEKAKIFSKESGGSFTYTNNMKEAFKDADVVYPKSWAPYWVAEKRTKLLEKNDTEALKELEKECIKENTKHMDWLCDEDLMKVTKKGEALYMHCLPADVQGLNCDHGEVTREVFDKYRFETYKEARNKPYIIAAAILLSRFKNPVAVIENVLRENRSRLG